MRANNDRKKNGWAQIFLFIIFLILLALVLNGMGWCIGGCLLYTSPSPRDS